VFSRVGERPINGREGDEGNVRSSNWAKKSTLRGGQKKDPSVPSVPRGEKKGTPGTKKKGASRIQSARTVPGNFFLVCGGKQGGGLIGIKC